VICIGDGCIAAPQKKHISVLDRELVRPLKRLFVPLWLDKKVEGIGYGCSVVSLPALAWEMKSCTIVDDIECDGVIALQISPESGVFANGSVVGSAPGWSVVVAMIVVV
jgi:hypothetical protein